MRRERQRQATGAAVGLQAFCGWHVSSCPSPSRCGPVGASSVPSRLSAKQDLRHSFRLLFNSFDSGRLRFGADGPG